MENKSKDKKPAGSFLKKNFMRPTIAWESKQQKNNDFEFLKAKLAKSQQKYLKEESNEAVVAVKDKTKRPRTSAARVCIKEIEVKEPPCDAADCQREKNTNADKVEIERLKMKVLVLERQVQILKRKNRKLKHDKTEAEFSHVELGRIISAQPQSTLHLARFRNNPAIVTKMTTVTVTPADHRFAQSECERLRKALSQHHRNVCQLVAVVMSPSHHCHVVWSTPVTGGRTLQEELALPDNAKGLRVKEVMRISSSVCEGMRHLHANHVTHGNLNASNVIIFSSGDDVKICDFGFAQFRENGENEEANAELHDVKSFTKMLTQMLTGFNKVDDDEVTMTMTSSRNKEEVVTSRYLRMLVWELEKFVETSSTKSACFDFIAAKLSQVSEKSAALIRDEVMTSRASPRRALSRGDATMTELTSRMDEVKRGFDERFRGYMIEMDDICRRQLSTSNQPFLD